MGHINRRQGWRLLAAVCFLTLGGLHMADAQCKLLSETSQPRQSSAPQFFDVPQFTVAGVTDASTPGGHGTAAAVKTKEALGTNLLRQVGKSPVPTYTFWSLTRLGARMLFYGPLNLVVHPQVVEGWLDQLLAFQPGNDSEKNGWAFCLANLARLTGQRALDVDEATRARVLGALRALKVPAHWTDMVERIVEMDAGDRGQLFGESLPIGLRLVG